MKKITLFAIAFLIFSAHLGFSETVSLSTYYPAPFGTYDRIRLVPRDPIVTSPCQIGTFYTRNDTLELEYCGNVGGVGGWGPMAGLWENDGANNISLVDTATVNHKVGIGDVSAAAYLEVSASGTATDILMLSSNDNNDGDRLIVKADGRVGIGVAPAAGVIFNVAGLTHLYNGTNEDLRVGRQTGQHISIEVQDVNAYVDYEQDSDGNGNHQFTFRNNASGTGNNSIDFETSGTNRLKINDNGNIDIGSASDLGVVTAQELNVRGSINLRDNNVNWGKLAVGYSGNAYYAVYAP